VVDTPRQEQLDLSSSDGTAQPPAAAPSEPVQAGLFPDDSVPDELVGYRGPSACQIAGITYRQLDYWARTSLVVPSIRSAAGSGSQRLYSFKDILVLKVVKRLLDTGVSLQNIRLAVDALRQRGVDDLARITLLSDGTTVYECTSSEEVVDLLRGSLPMVEEEPATTSWYGMRLGDSTFGIFDTFADDSGRQAHLAGRVAQELQHRGADLFSRPPVIERIDVLACKLP
jgi:DNA-binding transcriptional MerR regulator